MFKRKGGGVKGFLNNVKKNCTFLAGWLPWPPFQLIVKSDLLTLKNIRSQISDGKITIIHIDCISREEVSSFLQDGRAGWGCGGENHELPFKNVPSNSQPASQTIYG